MDTNVDVLVLWSFHYLCSQGSQKEPNNFQFKRTGSWIAATGWERALFQRRASCHGDVNADVFSTATNTQKSRPFSFLSLFFFYEQIYLPSRLENDQTSLVFFFFYPLPTPFLPHHFVLDLSVPLHFKQESHLRRERRWWQPHGHLRRQIPERSLKSTTLMTKSVAHQLFVLTQTLWKARSGQPLTTGSSTWP